MSKLFKTSRGNTVDLDKLRLANENVIAVGNMKTNARGDVIGRNGQVLATRNQAADKAFASTGSIQAAAPQRTTSPAPYSASAPVALSPQQLNDAIAPLVNPNYKPEPITADIPAPITEKPGKSGSK